MILVTGGNGFIGTNLINRLVKDKESIISFDKKKCKRKDINIFQGDVSKFKDLKFFIENIKGVEVIIHLGAIARVHTSIKEPRKVLINNLVSTINVLDYAKEFNIPVIYAGSSSRYAGANKSPYAFSKYKGEELCKLYNQLYGLRTYVCRFYNVYGEHQIEKGKYSTVIGVFEKQYRENKPLTIVGDGTQKRDFTHVDDIVDGLIRISQTNKIHEDAWELGSGRNYSVNELFGFFQERFGVESTYIPEQKGNYRETLNTNPDAERYLGWCPQDKLEEYIRTL